MQKVVKNNFKALKGEITVPADKSISHRAVLFSSLAKGKSIIKNFSNGQDPLTTVNILRQLGTEISVDNHEIIINSNGKFTPSDNNIYYCNNSGTTMRLLSGVLAGKNFNSVLAGDESLSKRPMKRIIEPLTLMGANIDSNGFKAPLKIYGQNLHGINYNSKIASAQVKSCILLAGLNAEGETFYTEPYISRNHTEIMLCAMGADIKIFGKTTAIRKSELTPLNIEIPGDISSASFFIAGALIVPNSKILLKNVGLNPTRTGIIEIIQKMGANIEILNLHETSKELVGDIKIEYSQLKGCEISGEIIPKLIDEIPILSVIATQAQGDTVIKDAQDLRNKESDRISTVVNELTKLGARIDETPDGMVIHGKTNLNGGCEVQTYNDHRLAMSLYIAGLVCKKEILINGFEWAKISFPRFEELIESLKV